MPRAYKYRLYPTREQEEYFAKCFGCARFIYNKMLDDKIKHYKKTKQMLNNTPAQYKQDYPWLKEVDSLALANAQLYLQSAYRKFFKEKSVGFPRFKRKRNYNSYTTNNQKGTISIEHGFIKLPKLKTRVKLVIDREFSGVVKSATVSKTPTNKYFVSILVDEDIKRLPKSSNKIGIDVGIRDFAVPSKGDAINNPKWFRQSEKRLAKLQRQLSKKKKGSKNREKARLKVALLHVKIANQRNDFLHKLSTQLINDNQVIVIEDLRVKNMLKNSKLSKAISEVSWSEFRRQLEYKANWYGRDIIVAPSNYASSQLCSSCGHKNKAVKDLKVRNWTCPNCNTRHDRDINASKNLLKLAL